MEKKYFEARTKGPLIMGMSSNSFSFQYDSILISSFPVLRLAQETVMMVKVHSRSGKVFSKTHSMDTKILEMNFKCNLDLF